MNDEEEGATQVMLESHQPETPEKKLERNEQSEADIRDEGMDDVIVAIGDESIVIDGEDKASVVVAPAENEVERGEYEEADGAAEEIEEKEVAGDEGREDINGDEVDREKEDGLVAGAGNVIAARNDVVEAAPVDENLDRDMEAQKDKNQDDVVEREIEEEDSSQLNGDGLLSVSLQDVEMVEGGKGKGSDAEYKVVDDNGLALKEDADGTEVEERQTETEPEENQVNVGIKLGDEEEAPKVKEYCSVGDEEKLDGGKKNDDESNVGAETAKAEEEAGGSQLNGDGVSPVISQDDEMKESKIELKEKSEGMEEDEREEAPQSGSGKRKRGKNSKSATKATPKKILEEDVCFICLDGGDLVLCDRRGCPKAYHPLCVDRDEAFFRSKGRWDCGWHLCRECKKNAYYMCYTCQCSLCKGCRTDDTSFFCVRGSKGLCQTCMKSVMLIENNEGNAQMATFDDKSSMDYLFKDYWTEQKENLSLSSDEIAMLIRQWKKSNADPNQEMLTEAHECNNEGGVISDTSLGNTAEPTNSLRKKSKKQTRSSTVELDYDADDSAGKAEAASAKKRGRRNLNSQSEGTDSNLDNSKRKRAKRRSDAHANVSQWASKELLEFVAHVKNGDISALSQFDVQALLQEYVKRHKLRDPRQSSQIVCDAMLQKLFGKERVGHIEMLKLLESHFLSVEDSQGDDIQGSVLDDENTDSVTDVGKNRGRKARKKGYSRGLQSNLDDYAAIDMHNIKLIYLRRNLIEALMEDMESFHVKVVGSFVRIRIIGSTQKQELHRLVQVIGTRKAVEPYKVGKKTADCVLEILNLHKREVVAMDAISNQDFDEDECKRLRQSIKCGFLTRLTVGDVLDKAKDLHVVRATDWLETEITRYIHLRDRASDFGRKKNLRECVEKLQLLNSPEERQRRLDEVPLVHADPNMDPSYESEDESESDKGGDIWRKDSRRERDHLPSRRGPDSPSTDRWSSAARSPSKKWEPTRSLSGKGFSSRSPDAVIAEEALSGKPWSPAGNKVSPQPTSSEKLRTPSGPFAGTPAQLSETRTNLPVSETSVSPAAPVVKNEVKINENEKSWHYRDPTGKVQGPFSVAQLRKWNKSGYFPATLKIWRITQTENDSILLSSALSGSSEKEPTKPVETPPQQTPRGQVLSTLKIDHNRITDQLSPTVQRSQSDPRLSSNESQNRPTSSQSNSSSATGRTRVSRWSGSPTPIVQLPSTVSSIPDSIQVPRSSTSPSYQQKQAFERSNSTQQPTATVSTNISAVQPSTAQTPVVSSAYGWQSTGHMVNQNLSNTNSIYAQGQQQPQQQQQPVYGHWQNTAVNNLPPPPTPTYSATEQTSTSATIPAPSQAQWTSQVHTVQQNQGVAAAQIPGNPAWAQMQAYMNMGWVPPTAQFPYGQYVSQPGSVPNAAMVQPALGMQPGNMNPAGWATTTTNPGVVGPWNWQSPQAQAQAQAQGMVAQGTQQSMGQKVCPYMMQGNCKNGAACEFRHS